MEGKSRKHKKAKKMHGFEGRSHRKTRRRVSHKVSHVLHGASKGFDAAGIAVDVAGLLAGAIGLSALAGFVPIKNPKIKTIIPLGLGILGLSMPSISKNRFMNRVSLGALAIGGYSLTKQLVPQIPLMGATDTAEGIGYAIQALPPEEKAILGILPDETPALEYRGDGEMLGDTSMIEGAAPGEMLGTAPGEMLGETSMIEGIPGEMLGDTTMINGEDFSGEDFE